MEVRIKATTDPPTTTAVATTIAIPKNRKASGSCSVLTAFANASRRITPKNTRVTVDDGMTAVYAYGSERFPLVA